MEDYQKDSPDIVVLPAEAEVREAVDKLKLESGRSQFLKGVTEIVVKSIPGAVGYVTNKPGEEDTIFVDYYRLKGDLQSKNPGISPEELKEELVTQLMEVLSHEKGHLEAGLDKGELPAEQAAEKTIDWRIGNLKKAMSVFAKLSQ